MAKDLMNNDGYDVYDYKKYIKVCPICGKEFDIYGTNWNWRDKSRTIFFCSYTCTRKYDLKHEDVKEKAKIEKELEGQWK